MRTYVLKINVNNIHSEIQRDYFKYRDIFYKCLIVNLCICSKLTIENLHQSSIIEDSHYNQYLIYLINSNMTLEDLIKEIDPVYNVSIFTDTHIYLEEFINMKHNQSLLNVYSLTIDDAYNIVITNKQLRRHYAQ